MSCGAVAKTCLIVGEVDHSYLPFVQGIIDTFGWRVFHFGQQKQGILEHPQYRYHQGELDNELLLRTLFVQYDFCAVSEVDSSTPLIETIARNQWHEDFETRRYLRMGKGSMCNEIVDGFLCDTSFDSHSLSKNLTTVINLLDAEKSLPESLPFF